MKTANRKLPAVSSVRYILFLLTAAFVTIRPAWPSPACNSSTRRPYDSTLTYRAVPMLDAPFTRSGLHSKLLQVPGLAHPIIAFWGSQHVFTINKDIKFVAYTEAFPSSPLDDHYVREDWDDRTVGLKYQGGVYVLASGSDTFVRLDKKVNNIWHGPFILEREKTTLVTKNGVIYSVGFDSLQHWLDLDHSLGNMPLQADAVHESGSLHALIVDRKGKVFAVDDLTRQATYLTEIPADENDPLVFDLARSRSALVTSKTRVLQIFRSENGFVARSLLPTVHEASPFFRSKLFEEAFIYGSTWFFQRPRVKAVDVTGFVNVEGGNIELKQPLAWPDVAKDLPSLHKIAIVARTGLHLYDGNRIQRVSGTSRDEIGEIHDVFDSETLHKVIIITDQGLFELTLDLVPRRINVSALSDTHGSLELIDWPTADAVLVLRTCLRRPVLLTASA